MSECVVIPAGRPHEGRTGVSYAAGVSAATAGARALCLQIASLPPGARAQPHLHEDHESAAYVVEGEIVLYHGAELEHRSVARAGDFLYIPAGVPHLPANESDAPAVTVLARTDPNEQESVTLLADREVTR
jgi:uncharacterized RmlC-like cupin family protein